MAPATASLSKLPRLTSWWLIALALSALVFLLAPQQIPVSLYKLNLMALAAVAGYWIDRKVFPYARPDTSALQHLPKPSGSPTAAAATNIHSSPVDPVPLYFMLGCMLRRAILMAAAILAISLGG